jgi:hypothetical protein
MAHSTFDVLKKYKEEILYKLICLFFIISSFTSLLDFLHLRAISKLFQVLVITIICSTLALTAITKSADKYKNSVVKLIVLILLYLISLFVVDIFTNKISPFIVFRNFLQIFFIYFWIFISFCISNILLDKILGFIKTFFYIGLYISLIEFIMPISIKEVIISSVYGIGTVPASYFSREIAFFPFRLGSFYFEPLTFSFTLLFLICCYTNAKTKNNTLIYITMILSQIKTAILGGFLILIAKNRRIINIIGLLSFAFVIFICFSFDGWFFYYAFNNTVFKSAANHLAGLVFGIQEAFQNLFGNGLGLSGYLTALDAKNYPALSSLYSITPLETGNESTIGVIGYQLGGFFLVLHLILFVKIYFFHLKNKNYRIASFTLLIMLFQLFSESALTLLISFCSAFLFAKSSNKSSLMSCESVKNIRGGG